MTPQYCPVLRSPHRLRTQEMGNSGVCTCTHTHTHAHVPEAQMHTGELGLATAQPRIQRVGNPTLGVGLGDNWEHGALQTHTATGGGREALSSPCLLRSHHPQPWDRSQVRGGSEWAVLLLYGLKQVTLPPRASVLSSKMGITKACTQKLRNRKSVKECPTNGGCVGGGRVTTTTCFFLRAQEKLRVGLKGVETQRGS